MSSKQLHKLSGAEALEEYFTSLLDEEWDFHEDSVSSPLKAVETISEKTVIVEVNDDISNEHLVIENLPTESTEAESLSSQASSVDLVSADLELEPAVSEMVGTEPVLEVQTQASYQPTFAELKYNEYEVPDLDDIQKLLDKMESTDLAAEPEIVSLIEQNTSNIHQVKQDEVIAETNPEVEEIQEWDTDVEEPVIEASENIYHTEEVETEIEVETELETEFSPAIFDDWKSTERDIDFQVLYFDVNGVTFAVPLDELGGIHKIGEMSHLIGRPGWYLGLQTNKDTQYDVVDTAKWVMADRLKDGSYKESYQYIVMLGSSAWGLAATELKGTESLNVESVRWREQAGKRPWLAGMVKEKMCALIHVEAMITMIVAGMDVKSLDS